MCNLCVYFLAVLDPKLSMFALHPVARQPINVDFVTALNEKCRIRRPYYMPLLSHAYIYSKFFHSLPVVFAWKMKYALAELHGVGSCPRIRLLLPSPRHESCAPCSSWHAFNKTSLCPFCFSSPSPPPPPAISPVGAARTERQIFYTEVIATAVHCRNSVDVNV